jgi:hypothetical protein
MTKWPAFGITRVSARGSDVMTEYDQAATSLGFDRDRLAGRIYVSGLDDPSLRSSG